MDQAYESIIKSKKSALVYAATSLMQRMRAASLALPIPETEPQEFVAVGTPEQIAALLPEAGIKPARRKDDVRPTEPLSFEDEAPAAPAVTVSPVIKSAPEYLRVREEFECVASIGTDADIESAMMNVDILIDTIARQAQPTDRDAEWISVDERLPADETDVLALRNGKYQIAAIFIEHESWEEGGREIRYWDDPNDDGQGWGWEEITHWMPLPAIRALKGKSGEGAAS